MHAEKFKLAIVLNGSCLHPALWKWSGSALPPVCCRGSVLAGFSHQGSSTRADLSGCLKPDVTAHRIFLKPVIHSWAVLGTEPKPEVKGNPTASSPKAVGTRVSMSWPQLRLVWECLQACFETLLCKPVPSPSVVSELGAFWAPMTDMCQTGQHLLGQTARSEHGLWGSQWLQWQCVLLPLWIYSYTPKYFCESQHWALICILFSSNRECFMISLSSSLKGLMSLIVLSWALQTQKLEDKNLQRLQYRVYTWDLRANIRIKWFNRIQFLLEIKKRPILGSFKRSFKAFGI